MALSIDFTNSTQLSNTSINATAFSVGTNFIANATQVTIAAGIPLSANGGVGSGTQVLTSNGATGSPYWAAVTATIPSYVVNTSGNFTIAGNLSFTGTNTYFSTASYFNTSIIFTGNTTTLPTITLANTGAFTIGNSSTTQTAATLAVANSTGNVQITAGTTSILATGIVNAASHTVGTNFIANSLGVYTGIVNAASHTVGTNFIANSLGVYTGIVNGSTLSVGTSTIANSLGVYTGIINATTHSAGPNVGFTNASILFTGNTTTSPTITLANTGNFVIGNSSTTQTTSTIVVANSTGNVQITPGTSSILATGSINAASYNAGANLVLNNTNLLWTGNSTTSPTITLPNTGAFTIGNSSTTQTAATISVANSTGNVRITAGTTSILATGSVNALSYATGPNVGFTTASFLFTGNTTTSPTITLANTGAFTIGNSTTTQTAATITVANSTGNVQITPGTTSILATGIINAASHTVGTSFIANSTAIIGTGYANVTTSVNSALFTVGTAFTANATMTNTASLVVSTNTATIGTAAYHVSNGYFGINKSAPTYRLDLATNTNANDGGWFYNSNTGASAQAVVTVQTNGASGLSLGQGYTAKNAFLYLADNAKMELSTNATVAMTIAANGNIGIGSSVSNIKSPLTITPTLYQTGNPTPNKLRLYDDGANNYYAMGVSTVGGMDLISAGPTTLSFVTQSTNAIYSFAKFSNNQLLLNGTDGTTALLLAGATKAVRIFPSISGTYIEGVDNTGVGSYQTLVIGGSQVSMTISNVEKAKLDSSGNFTIPSQPICQANNLTYVSSYVNGQTINFTGGYDPRSMFGSNNSFTVPVAGRYMIHFDLLLETSSIQPLAVGLYKNGSIIKRMYTDKPAYTGVADGYYMASLTHIVNAAASDYFQAVAQLGSMGSPMKVYGDATSTSNIGGFTIYLIG